jgi:hypothetical protein
MRAGRRRSPGGLVGAVLGCVRGAPGGADRVAGEGDLDDDRDRPRAAYPSLVHRLPCEVVADAQARYFRTTGSSTPLVSAIQ